MVSVIVPVYNVEKYVSACLESILQQTYRDLEIVVIDDGSADRSGAICQEYSARDERIRCYRTEHRGMSDARNLGLQLCTGEQVSFVDSDDRLHPQAIEFMLRAMREKKVPVVRTDFCRIYGEENPPFASFVYDMLPVVEQDGMAEIKNSFSKELLRVVWGGLYTKSSLEGLCFESGRFHEDAMFVFGLLSRNPEIARIEAPLYQYRRRQGSVVMHAVAGKIDLDRLEVGRQMIDFLSETNPELAELAKAELITECVSRNNLARYNGCDPLYEEALTKCVHDCLKTSKPRLPMLWNADIPLRRRLLCLTAAISFPATCWLKHRIVSLLNR